MPECSDARPEGEGRTPEEVEAFGVDTYGDELELIRKLPPDTQRLVLLLIHALGCGECCGTDIDRWLPDFVAKRDEFLAWAESSGVVDCWLRYGDEIARRMLTGDLAEWESCTDRLDR